MTVVRPRPVRVRPVPVARGAPVRVPVAPVRPVREPGLPVVAITVRLATARSDPVARPVPEVPRAPARTVRRVPEALPEAAGPRAPAVPVPADPAALALPPAPA
ncbi:hypothetical protein PUR56_00685, partial [Streptomyces sp. BE303]|nr:hypothetical protein [Streptomyces sp. BE303]